MLAVTDTGTYINIMRESLVRKVGYLKQILELTENQTTIIKTADFDEDAFNTAIDSKEVLINNINEIDKGFTAVYDRIRSDVLENTALEQVLSVGFNGVRKAKQSRQMVNKYYKSMSNGMVNDSMLYDRKK